MSTRDPDYVVIGSGPNGLAAAATLARAGMHVLVLERHPLRPGGAVGSDARTLPGFLHDVGAAFFPWGRLSPAFRSLELDRHGLAWKNAEFESCHPAPDGSYACIARDADLTAEHFGSRADGARWREVARWYARHEPEILALLLGPLPGAPAAALRLGSALTRLGTIFTTSGGGLARRWFRSPAARRVLPGLALHVDVGPDDMFGAALGFMLGMTATTGGFSVPVGGAQTVTDALVASLRAAGGELRLDAGVERLEFDHDRVVAVRTHHGEEIRVQKGVLADTDVVALFERLIPRELVPTRISERLVDYPRGFATFKLDWALREPVPWSCEAARSSAVIHAGDGLTDLSRFTAQVRAGDLPDNPYLVIGQQSLVDPSRVPAGGQTLWAYSRVPARPGGGWRAHAQSFADRIEARIEGLAPGFRETILARCITTPPDLEAMDENLVDGDLGGGSNAWNRQLFFRPLFPHFNYRMPYEGLYLCSSYAHPGAGVHGMCGFNAAHAALRDA